MATIVAVDAREVDWAIAATGANVRGAHARRRGVIVGVRAASGASGLGEATPLDAKLVAGAREDVERLRAAGAFAVETLDDVVAIAARVARTAAGRFAIETALADLLARDRGVTLGEWLDGAAVRAIEVAVVVDDADAAAAAWAVGARTLKVKVGRGDDGVRVAAIVARVPGPRLRLDANRAWEAGEVRARLAELAAIAGDAIEYVEEPCRVIDALRDGELACPIALDESIGELRARGELAAWLALPMVAAIVLKPTELGGLGEMLALARAARAAGKHAIVSHALEGPIAMAACAELARAIGGDTPVGMAPHAGIAGWRLAVGQVAASGVSAVAEPGLGFARQMATVDAVVAAMPRDDEADA